MRALRSLAVLGVAAVCATAAPAMADESPDGSVRAELAKVRAATARYHDVTAAEEAGYLRGSDCVENMGYHYVRGGPLPKEDLDPTAPGILVYAPRPDGSLRLVAVEYGSTDADAELFGVTFDPPGGVPFPTLHAWVWQANPDGMSAAHNPRITCD